MSTTLTIHERAEQIIPTLRRKRAERAAMHRRTRACVPPMPKSKAGAKRWEKTHRTFGRDLARTNWKRGEKVPRVTPAAFRAHAAALVAYGESQVPADALACFGAEGFAMAQAARAMAAADAAVYLLAAEMLERGEA